MHEPATREQLERRLLSIRWQMGELENMICSQYQRDAARRTIDKFRWQEQQVEFKIAQMEHGEVMAE